MRKKLPIILIVMITFLLVIGTVVLRKIKTADVDTLPTIKQTPWALYVSPVKTGRVTKSFPVLTTLTGITDITVASQISGIINITGPREGVRIKKNDIIAEILVQDLIEERAGILYQRDVAVSEQARTVNELKRQTKLITKNLTAQELVDTKKSAVIAAKNQVLIIDKKLSAINVRISYGVIRAPQDAIISEKLVEAGDIAQPGKPLYKLTVDSAARINLHLPQQVLETIHINSKVLLTHNNKEETVLLSRIFPSLNSHNIGFAEADLNAMPFDLRSGAKISGRIILEEIENTTIIPAQALLISHQDENKGFVYKMIEDNGIARIARVNVEILLRGREGVAISGDLSELDEVVTAHQSVLMQLNNNDFILPSKVNYHEF